MAIMTPVVVISAWAPRPRSSMELDAHRWRRKSQHALLGKSPSTSSLTSRAWRRTSRRTTQSTRSLKASHDCNGWRQPGRSGVGRCSMPGSATRSWRCSNCGAITRHEALPLVFARTALAKGWLVPTDVRDHPAGDARRYLIWLEAELTLREVRARWCWSRKPPSRNQWPSRSLTETARWCSRRRSTVRPRPGPPVRRQPGAHDDGHRLHRAHHPGGRTLGHVGLALLR